MPAPSHSFHLPCPCPRCAFQFQFQFEFAPIQRPTPFLRLPSFARLLVAPLSFCSSFPRIFFFSFSPSDFLLSYSSPLFSFAIRQKFLHQIVCPKGNFDLANVGVLTQINAKRCSPSQPRTKVPWIPKFLTSCNACNNAIRTTLL